MTLPGRRPGLSARRPGASAGTAPQGTAGSNALKEDVNAQDTQEQVQAHVQEQANEQVQQSAPAVRNNAPAVSGNATADLNMGILENIEDMSGGGNYVTVDGSDFLYKDSNGTTPEIELVVTYGKRYYQWVDESDPENKVYHDSDTKLDNRYKLKFEIKWIEEVDGEPKEYTLSLSTTSAIQFVNYVQSLAKQGLGVGNVITKATISRHQRKGSNDRYSRVDFQFVEQVQ